MQSNVFGTMTARTHWRLEKEELTHGRNLHFRKKVIKMLRGRFVHVGKSLTDVQILGCQLHQNAFDGRAPPGPAGEL